MSTSQEERMPKTGFIEEYAPCFKYKKYIHQYLKKNFDEGPQSEGSENSQRSNVFNPNNPAFKSAKDNRSNQMNPNNPA